MADFVNDFWSIWVATISLVGVLGCGVFLWATSRAQISTTTTETTGHAWDEDLMEYDNPMPKWWMMLFYITIVFALVYFYLYPALGKYQGSAGWSSTGQYDKEMKKADEEYGPIFAKFRAMEPEKVAADQQAREMGQRIFLNNCAQCHGSDARGSKGFPNLADKDWLYGGDFATIEKTILEGRHGVMPPMGAAVGGEEDITNVAHYVLSLSDSAHDSIKAAGGKAKFGACAACHGADGKGNPALGAPNLSDKTWLYGGSATAIAETIRKGRDNVMPAWKDILGTDKVRLVSAYVWGLSNTAPAQAK